MLPGHGGLVPPHFITELSGALHILLWKAAALRELLKSLHDNAVNEMCNRNVVCSHLQV